MKRAKRKKKTRCRGKSVKRDPLPERRRLALWKEAAFALVVVCLFFMGVEWVLSLAGVRPMLYEEDPYVGFSSTIPLFVEERNDEGQVIMVTAQNKINLFNAQRFARNKAEGAYRIFCLGGSTTYGRPYTDTSSFCGWLRELLPKADPSRQWELINAGGISYASYRVALLMEELIAYQPDMFVIYTGQNEFLEKRTYGKLMEKIGLVKSAEALLGRTRLYSLIRRSIKGRASQSGAETNVLEILPAEVETILERSVGPESYFRDEGFRREVLEHYRFNIERMIKIADSAGVAVVLVTPASNLRDSSPFKSQHRAGLSKAQRRRWEELFTRGSRLQGAGQWAEALSALDEAAAIDDRYAHLHYARGRTLWQMERFTEAKKAFVRALDEDVCPLRALPEMVSIVAETGRGHEAIIVDFAALAAAQSPHGTAGENLFLDHVHLTIRGYRMLALSIMDTLIEEEIVRPSPTWSEEMVDAVSQNVESQLDQRANGEALRNLAWVLGWAGKYEESYKLALQAVEMIPGDALALIKVAASAEQLGLIDEAVAYNQKTLAVKPDYTDAHVNLGNIYAKMGKPDVAVHHFNQALKIKADNEVALNHLGNVLAAQGKLDEAVQHYRRALKFKDNYAEAHNNLGNVLAAQGKLDEAVRYYRRALKFKDNYAEAHNNLGNALRLQGKTDEAIEQFHEALRLKDDFAEAYNNLGLTIQEQRGQPDEAIEYFRQALQINGDLVEVRNNLGNILQGQGKVEEAIEQFRLAIRIEPGSFLSHNNQANALLWQGKFEQAIGHFRRALQIQPHVAEIHNNLGFALKVQGKTREAIGHYRRALELKPDFELARNNLNDALQSQGGKPISP